MTEHPISPIPPEQAPHQGPALQAYGNGQGSGLAPGWPPPEDEEGFDWRKHAAALLRYKWIVLAGVALGVGGAYFTWERAEPEYLAQGSLWVQASALGDRGPIQTDGLFRAASWVDLISSHAVLDSVVLAEKLFVTADRPEDQRLFAGFALEDRFAPGSYTLRVSEGGDTVSLIRDREVMDRSAPGEPIGAELGFRWTVPAEGLVPLAEIRFSVATIRGTTERLRRQLGAELDRQGTFIRVSLRGKDPDRIANVVNAVMTRHVELAEELKSGHLDEQIELLAGQLRQVEEELREAERALESFRIETITLPSEERGAIQGGLEMTRGPVYGEFFRMRVEQEDKRRDRRRLEEVLQRISDGSAFPVETVELIPSVRGSSQLTEALSALVSARVERRTLLDRYTAEHPQVREVADRIRTLETERLPALVSDLTRQLRRDEEDLGNRIDASGTDLSDIPPRAIEEARLRRRVSIAENLYTNLRGRYENATLARRSSAPDVRILDQASAQDAPLGGQGSRTAALVFLIFAGGGIAVTVLLDRMDSRIRTPGDASSAVGLAVLGTVPRLRWTNGKKGSRNVNQVYEAFRELRTNLEYAYGSAGPLVATISSPSAEEGKTLVTTNLGIAFAGLGRRTLILDGDTRRGDIHHYLEGRRKPGLVDYLRSTHGQQEIIQTTAYHGLHFIGSGTHAPNSPELLGSPRMGRLMGDLRQSYDVILVDSPPLGAGADSIVLTALSGHMVLVIRSGSTNREFTQAKLEPLYRLPIRVLGVVLNDFVPDRLSSYYRHYGSYLPDYEPGVEEEEGEGGRIVAAGAAER